MRKLLLLLSLALGVRAVAQNAYQPGSGTQVHNHTTSPGDGGQLSSLNVLTSVTSPIGNFNKLSGAVQIGSQTYTVSGALDYSQGISSMNYTVVGSTYVLGVATVTFTNVVSSVTYMIEIEQFQPVSAASGGLVIWFNSNFNTSNTDHAFTFMNQGTTSATNATNNGGFACQLSGNNAPAAPGGGSHVIGYFRSEFRRGKNFWLQWQTMGDNTSGLAVIDGACVYRGASVSTQINIGQVNTNNSILSDYRITIWAKIGNDNAP
jgi:hypothetical protein